MKIHKIENGRWQKSSMEWMTDEDWENVPHKQLHEAYEGAEMIEIEATHEKIDIVKRKV